MMTVIGRWNSGDQRRPSMETVTAIRTTATPIIVDTIIIVSRRNTVLRKTIIISTRAAITLTLTRHECNTSCSNKEKTTMDTTTFRAETDEIEPEKAFKYFL